MTDRYQKPDETHHLNMKAVVRETGIKADTLRAWERRYGIPQPERSMGGHRLYSNRDVRILLWLKARQADGITIKLAVEEWRRLEDSGTDPFQVTYFEPESAHAAIAHTNLDSMRAEWVEACKAFDEVRAEQVLASAFAMFRPEQVGIELLTAGLAEIGSMWEEGVLTVQQEHFASEIARRKLEALIAAAPPPVRMGRVLILCPPGEDHAFIPLLITFLLRQTGRAVVFLGANVPVERLEDSLQSLKPVLVILSASQIKTAAAALDLLEVLREEGVLGAFGGSVFSRFPEYVDRMPAHFLGNDLTAVVDRVESLILHRPAPPEAFHDQLLKDAQERFIEELSLIEQSVFESLESSHNVYSRTASLNRFLSGQIAAILKLGEAKLPYTDREVFLECLRGYGYKDLDLEPYLDAYIHALQDVLGAESLITQAFLNLGTDSIGS